MNLATKQLLLRRSETGYIRKGCYFEKKIYSSSYDIGYSYECNMCIFVFLLLGNGSSRRV